MAREIKAKRYADGASPALVDLITSRLPYFSFAEAMEFYRDFVPRMNGSDLALLGCNDRFFLLTGLLNRPDAIHPWLYDRAREVEAEPYGYLDLWARGHYKMVDVNEPVPTPSGWKRHGDIEVGEYVFGPDGKPTKVVARTPVWTDGDCYRVTFDKGYSVVVGAEHLWTVDISSRSRVNGGNKRLKRKKVTLNTRQLIAEVNRSQSQFTTIPPSVMTCGPLEYAEKDLPVAPYVLGCWLGDGTSASGNITCGDDIWQEIAKTDAVGPNKTPHRNSQHRRIDGLAQRLRALGVLNNKRIPGIYEFAAIEQRIRLLQGLMDTDGHCDTRGKATFVNINADLAHDVFRLVAGLGLKPSIRPYSFVHNGQPYPYFQISFQVHPDRFDVFTLPRKQSRAKSPGRSTQALRHAIVSIEPVDRRPCSCIQVERDDGLYLIGEHHVTTHNSTITTFAGTIQDVLTDPEVTIGIFSNTKDLARPFLSQIKEELESNETLIRLYPDVLYTAPRKQSPSWSVDGGLTVKRKGNPKECTIEAHGLIDAMPTGRHFRKLKYDDIITERNVSNPEQIRKTTERVELSDNLGSGPGTTKEFVGTRYHFADSYGHMIEHGIVKPRLYPATDDGTLDGNPVLLTPEAWAEKKRSQRTQIAAQVLQNPIAGQENTFRTKWLLPYWVRPIMMNVYLMADPSKGKSKTSDRTAMAVIGIDAAGNKYLLDGYCHRMPLSERWAKFKGLRAKWAQHPGVQSIETGYERYGMQSDDEYFDEKMRLEGQSFDIIELNWTGDAGRESKKHRVERLEPDFRAGAFFVPAKVWHPAVAGHVASWAINQDTDEIIYTEIQGPHKQERRCRAHGEMHRLMEPIKRKDEDGNLYDLTRVFFEEYRFFPFSPRDDFIDSMSRIYDMEPRAALVHERLQVEDYQDA